MNVLLPYSLFFSEVEKMEVITDIFRWKGIPGSGFAERGGGRQGCQ